MSPSYDKPPEQDEAPVLRCPDCRTTTESSLRQSAVAGLISCRHCGKVFAEPDDVREARIGRETEDAMAGIEETPATSDSTLVVPDQVECDYGWRAWEVKPEWPSGGVPILASVFRKEQFWVPGAPMVARCDKAKPGKEHEIPHEPCTCGLYAAKTREHLGTMPYQKYDAEKTGKYRVIGKVKLWGKVIEGHLGWRAEMGYPEKLYVPFEIAMTLATPLAQAYGVEVELMNWLEEIE